MKRYNFFLPEQLVETIRGQAEKSGLTMAELIRRALTNYVAETQAKTPAPQ